MEAIIMTNNTNKQEDIFSMFGLVDEHEAKKKEEAKVAEELRQQELKETMDKKMAAAKENAQSDSKTPAKKAVKKEDVFKPNEDTVIKYFGFDIPVTKYFTPEELVEGLLVKKKDGTERKPLDGEMLRKRMEKEYLELVKEFTAVIFLEKQNVIVITMQARKKGNCSESEGLSADSTSLSFPKIPYALLNDFIALSKFYGTYNLEIAGAFYYCPKSDKHFLDIPAQNIHRYWAEVTETPYSITERMQFAVKIMEIHSHHTMKPIPSAQDNESERVPGMYYAIVGNTDTFFPSVTLRKFISEAIGHSPKALSDMFESPFEQLPNFDAESIEVFTE